MANFAFEDTCISEEIPMDKHPSRQTSDSTNLFDGNRSGEIVPPDNLSDARLAPPERQQSHGRQTYRLEGGGTIEINDSNVTINNYIVQGDGYRQDSRPVRVGRGQGSMCPEYNDYATSRQAYQEEAWLNRGDSYDQRPIPQCHHRQQSRYDSGPSRYGDVQAVSAGQYDYDYQRQHERRGRSPIDQFFNAIGSVARGIGDVAYEAAPIIQTWAQIEMIKQGRVGGHYYGGYDNGYYNQRPYNPWNSRQNRDLIAYNNNSGYYDNYSYNDRYYQPSWLNG